MEGLNLKTATLEEAKNWLRERLHEGERCPCCTQFAKVYKKKLNSGMVSRLVHLERMSRGDNVWISVNDLYSKTKSVSPKDFPCLKHWQLIEAKGDTPDDGAKSSGYWRITDLGRQFVRGEVSMKRYIYLYDNRLMKFSEETITIHEALGDNFDFKELMRS